MFLFPSLYSPQSVALFRRLRRNSADLTDAKPILPLHKMSKRTIKYRRNKSAATSFGVVGLIVCCVLGAENSDYLARFSESVYGQQQSSQASSQNQIVYFSLPIGVETAPVLASPSTNTYQTGAVSQGDHVEVYFRNEEGYCAIRPPQGSFSWINGKFVQLDSDSVGRVYSATGKTVPSRVGGPTPAMSSVVQVGLKNEQKVKILGHTTLPNGSVWYRIAPPPGEFRWVHESSLVQTDSLAKLPTRLTFQSEYLAQLNAPRNKGAAPQNTNGYRDPGATSAQKLDLANSNTKELPLPQLDLDETFSPKINADAFDFAQTRPNSLTNATKAESSKQETSDVYDQKSFQREIASLNSDVFKTLQKSNPSSSELSSLQARAENLFDRAPNDDQRFLVQSTFDAITQAQIRAQKSAVVGVTANGMPVANIPGANQIAGTGFGVEQFANGAQINGQFANSPYLGNGQFFDQNGRLIGGAFTNGQDSGGLQIVNGQIVGTPMMIDGQYVVDAKIISDNVASETASPSDSKSKSKLGFAFSNTNNPFHRSSPRAGSTGGKTRTSRLESSLSHLPGIAQNQNTPTTIVPPQNYGVPRGGRLNKSLASSDLTPGPLRNELSRNNKSLPAATTTIPGQNAYATQVQQGALVFQRPQVSNNGADSGSGDITPSTKTSSNWKAVTNEPSVSEPASILPASGESPQNGDSKIRSTSAFAPVASGSFDKLETMGVLIELSNVSDGAPRYALLDKADDSFNIVAYLDPGKNVSFDKFVGQKVVVKGTTGTVTINGKAQKHVVVSSLFLIK